MSPLDVLARNHRYIRVRLQLLIACVRCRNDGFVQHMLTCSRIRICGKGVPPPVDATPKASAAVTFMTIFFEM